MSDTYFNPHKKSEYDIDNLQAPQYLIEYLNHLYRVKKLSKQTVYSYFMSLQTLLKWLYLNDHPGIRTAAAKISEVSFERVAGLSTADLQKYLKYLQKRRGNSVASLTPKISAMRSFFSYLHTTGKIEADPMAAIPQVKGKKKDPKAIKDEDIRKILECVRETEDPERNVCIATLFLNTGLTLTELTGLNMADIQGEALKIRRAGSRTRTVYLNQDCRDALENWIEVRNTFYGSDSTAALFISRVKGKRLANPTVQSMFNRTFKKVGLSGKGYSAAQFRHTVALKLMESGAMDASELQQVFGHISATTESRYAKVVEKRNDKAIKAAMTGFKLMEEEKDLEEDNGTKENEAVR